MVTTAANDGDAADDYRGSELLAQSCVSLGGLSRSLQVCFFIRGFGVQDFRDVKKKRAQTDLVQVGDELTVACGGFFQEMQRVTAKTDKEKESARMHPSMPAFACDLVAGKKTGYDKAFKDMKKKRAQNDIGQASDELTCASRGLSQEMQRVTAKTDTEKESARVHLHRPAFVCGCVAGKKTGLDKDGRA